MLNSVLYHVGLLWMISSNKKMKYDIEEKNPDWLNKGPWYNTTMYYKFDGTKFEDFIINDIKDRYNIMCYMTAHYRQQSKYVDNSISSGGIAIPKNATTASLKSLGATLNFIDCWLKHFQQTYQ